MLKSETLICTSLVESYGFWLADEGSEFNFEFINSFLKGPDLLGLLRGFKLDRLFILTMPSIRSKLVKINKNLICISTKSIGLKIIIQTGDTQQVGASTSKIGYNLKSTTSILTGHRKHSYGLTSYRYKQLNIKKSESCGMKLLILNLLQIRIKRN